MHAHAIDAFSLPQGARQEALTTIARGLRPADREEALAATGGEPEGILAESFRLSTHAWFIVDRENAPIAVFGVAPSALAGVGVVWMMGTEGVEREWVRVARETRRYLDEMHQTYHMLWNFIDTRNELSIQWLTRSGFHLIGGVAEYGPGRRPFYEFARLG